MLDEANVVPVLDSVLDFAQTALAADAEAQSTIASLQAKIAQHDQVVLEKVAAAKSNVLSPTDVDRVVADLVQYRLVSNMDGVKVASKLKSDPGAALQLITKLAESLVSPSEGRELIEDAGSALDDDVDGWGAMAEGKTVHLRP